MLVRNFMIFAVVAVLMTVTTGLMSGTASARALLGVPVYNPDTKSYFLLIDGRFYRGQGPNWQEARDLAREQTLAGVQGRLGIIASPETEMFVRLNLRPDHSTWFGLHYDCGSRQLAWADGTEFKTGGYTNWSPRGYDVVNRFGFCPGGHPLMSVYLKVDTRDRHWGLQHAPKRYSYFLVEFPTGRKLNEEELDQSLFNARNAPPLIEVPRSSDAASQ